MKNRFHSVHGVSRRVGIPDVAPDYFEPAPALLWNRVKVTQGLARVRPRQNADMAFLFQKPFDEVTADEAGASGDKNRTSRHEETMGGAVWSVKVIVADGFLLGNVEFAVGGAK